MLVHELGAVEEALGRLWKASAETAPAGQAVLRAATFNLVAIAPSERDGQEAAAVLAEVTAQHPGRVLIVCAEPDAPARLEARLSVHCRTIGTSMQVCTEQVVILAAGDAVERVGRAVPVLFVPDCTAIAWWRGGPGPAAAMLDQLAPSLDAVLLDGARFDPGALPHWAERLRLAGAPLAVGDLAWERARAWRGCLADGFEPADRRPALRGLSAVRVEHGAGAGMVGLLFVAWLDAALRWSPGPGLVPSGAGGWTGRLAGGRVAVAVTAGGAGPGLTAVRLESAAERLTCRLGREGRDALTLTLEAPDGVSQRRVIRHSEPDEVALVGHWLEQADWDACYGEALGRLGTLVAGSRA